MGSSGEEDLELGATPDPGAGGARLTRAPVRVQSEPELVHITVLEVSSRVSHLVKNYFKMRIARLTRAPVRGSNRRRGGCHF